ncbi:MAG: hypothetical protein AAGH79_10915 [Bacteroidota bacterium]
MMNKYVRFLLILACSISVSSLVAQSNRFVLKTDADGQVIEGSVEGLIDKINAGYAVRVSWGFDMDKDGQIDLVHWVDAEFISILNGHVFTQIAPIYKQSPKLEIPQVQISTSSVQWTGIIGTNGKLVSRYIIPDIDRIEDQELRAMMEKRAAAKERMVATTWVVVE